MSEPAGDQEQNPADATDATEPGGTVTGRDDHRSLLGSSAVMAVGTMLSRVTGFGRSLFLVWALGTGLFADTFNLANSIPTSIYILVAGGALNAVFVPQLVRAMKNDPDGGQAFGQRLLTATSLLLAGVSLVAVLAAPLLIWVFGAGLAQQPEAFDQAVVFARYCLPQIFFYGLYVILGQILNARGNFGPMMWAPILNNLISIAVFATYIVLTDAHTPGELTVGEEALLGLGTTAGIVVQALVLVPVLRRTGFRLRPRFDLRGSGLGKTGRLAAWTVGFVIVNQLWLVVVMQLTTGVSSEASEASSAGYGLTPYLSAFTIFQLPHAVVAVSIVTALLPRMSRAAADGDDAALRADLSQGLRTIAVAMLPAAAAFLALGPMITVAMYDHGGQVTHENARFIGYVLMGFAPGLIGFCSHYTVLRGFYAHEDTRTPVFVQLAVVGTSASAATVCYLVLPLEWKTVGFALSYGLGYWVGFAVSQQVLRRRIGGFDGGRIARTYARAGLAALVAGGAGFAVARSLVSLLGDGPWSSLIAATVGGLVLIGVYLLVGRLIGVRELHEILALARRRAAP